MTYQVTKTLKERFDEKWMPEPNSGCHLWTGANHSGGYGHIWANNRIEQAHRVSWQLKHDQIPDKNLQVCHRCDTPSCVNPDHLFLGDARVNILDAIAKGRKILMKRGGGKDWGKERNARPFRITPICKNGHLKSGDNLYVMPSGFAACKECRYQSKMKYKASRRPK